VAVDNLVEGFVSTGTVTPLRVGFAGKVKQALQSHTLDGKIATHPMKWDVDELNKDITEVGRKLKNAKMRMDGPASELRSVNVSVKMNERIGVLLRLFFWWGGGSGV
jgi:hypothetical protein